MSRILVTGLHLHCPGKAGHPLLTATRAGSAVRFVALFTEDGRTGARGWDAESGTVEVSCKCQREPMTVDLAKVAHRMRTKGYGGVSVVDYLA